MKGAFFLGADKNKKFEVREAELPALGVKDVLVKNCACGICGSDVHICHGEQGSAQVAPGVILGHEFAGEIVRVGEEVSDFKPGDHVTIDPNIYCGRCRPCKMGKKQNCENLSAIGVTRNGGFAEYCICPEAQCYHLDKDVSLDVGAMAEPLACAIHGIDLAGIKEGQNVLIIGGGAIGLLMVQLSRLAGAAKVILSEPVEMRRSIGLKVGADAAIDPLNESLKERLIDITGYEGVDVIIECVGKNAAVSQAFLAAAPGAMILLFSVPKVDAEFPVPLFDIYKKELKISGSMINPDTHQRAVNLINSGRIKIEELITHVYDLEHLDDAVCMQMSNESIKVVVHPWGE